MASWCENSKTRTNGACCTREDESCPQNLGHVVKMRRFGQNQTSFKRVAAAFLLLELLFFKTSMATNSSCAEALHAFLEKVPFFILLFLVKLFFGPRYLLTPHDHPGCACLRPGGQESDLGADGAVRLLRRLSNSLLLCRAVEGDPAAGDPAAQGLRIHRVLREGPAL